MMRMRQVDRILDLLVFQCWLIGQNNGMVPVDESRKLFEHIKKLIKKQP